jgi:hypothetical protein
MEKQSLRASIKFVIQSSNWFCAFWPPGAASSELVNSRHSDDQMRPNQHIKSHRPCCHALSLRRPGRRPLSVLSLSHALAPVPLSAYSWPPQQLLVLTTILNPSSSTASGGTLVGAGITSGRDEEDHVRPGWRGARSGDPRRSRRERQAADACGRKRKVEGKNVLPSRPQAVLLV